MNDQPGKPARKRYSKPMFYRYGDIKALTRTVGTMGKMDGGGPKALNKTF